MYCVRTSSCLWQLDHMKNLKFKLTPGNSKLGQIASSCRAGRALVPLSVAPDAKLEALIGAKIQRRLKVLCPDTCKAAAATFRHLHKSFRLSSSRSFRG